MVVVFIVVIDDDVDDCNDGEPQYMAVVEMMMMMTKMYETECDRESERKIEESIAPHSLSTTIRIIQRSIATRHVFFK